MIIKIMKKFWLIKKKTLSQITELNLNNPNGRDIRRLLQITYGIRDLNDDLSQAVDQFLENSNAISQKSVERLKESMIDNLIKGAHYQRLLDLFQKSRRK